MGRDGKGPPMSIARMRNVDKDLLGDWPDRRRAKLLMRTDKDHQSLFKEESSRIQDYPHKRKCAKAEDLLAELFCKADDHSEVQGNSTLSSSCGNSSNGNGHGSLDLVYGGDGNGAVLNIAGSSGPSVGASSLVTDANSGFSGGGPHLQISVSINNTKSYMRLPASPMSFSSNIRSVSGSPVMDGSYVIQQNQEPNSQQSYQSQQHQGSLSLLSSQLGQVQLSNNRFPSSFSQDLSYNSQLHKRSRLDIKQEEIARQQFLQPFMHRQDPLHFQNTHPQLQALIQQQRYQRQQEFLQAMPPQQRAQLLEQHQQQQLRHQYQQQGLQPPSVMKQSFDSGVCSRRLMQYLYHQGQRPQENTLAYWRKFVALYYAPQAKQRWCFSLDNSNNAGHHSAGVFPQVTLDASHCHICGSKSGKGFVATYDALPRLIDIKFGSGLLDELLYLDLPRESRSPSGEMMLEYAKAVLESVYEKLRVVHEGQLRIIFSSELQILSWEFCTRRHEEFLPRKLVAPQVNQLLDVVQKCQNTISEKGPNSVSHQANGNMAVAAGYQLARSLDLQSINDLGFNKRYARCLQISEVANGMKDLMDLCSDQKLGAIDALKGFARQGNPATSQPQQMQKMYNMLGAGGGGNQIIKTDRDEVRLNGLAQPPYTYENYKNLLAASRFPMNSDHSTLTHEAAAAAAAAALPSVNSRNQNQPPSPYNHQPPPSPLQQSSSNGNAAYNHDHQQLPPLAFQQSSNNGMQNSPQAWQQQHHLQETANNGGNGCRQQQYADNQNGPIHGNNGSILQDNPQAWQLQHHQTSQENGVGQQQQYADDQIENGVGLSYATETGLQNDNPAGTGAAENKGLKTDSNRESNVSGLDNGFNQKPVESVSQGGGMLGEAVSEKNAELTEDDFLPGDIDDYINFNNWDE